MADRAAVARKLGFTRARITQLLDLQLLAPGIQARVLELEAVDGVEPMRERALRAILRAGSWDPQRGIFKRLMSAPSAPNSGIAPRRRAPIR